MPRKFPFRTPPFTFDTPLAWSIDPDGLHAVLEAGSQHLLRGFGIGRPESSTALQNDQMAALLVTAHVDASNRPCVQAVPATSNKR